MNPFARLAALSLAAAALLPAQVPIPLNSVDKLTLRNVKAALTMFKGRQALQLIDAAPPDAGDEGRIAVINGTRFLDGAIELDLAGEPGPGAAGAARGFVGVAFRVASEPLRFECFYLRPTNGRADDQVRRNHSAQYISIPGFPWHLLRKQFPEKYETYVDLVPGEWIAVRVEVRGAQAKLFVHGVKQPTLIVNDLKQAPAAGAIALWIGTGTVSHFANLRVTLQ